MDDPLCPIAADYSGNSGIGGCASVSNDASQIVASHGLYHKVHILSGCEARPEADGLIRHVPCGPQVLLGQYGIHQSPGTHFFKHCAVLVNHDGHSSLLHDGAGFLIAGSLDTGNSLHLRRTVIYCFGKGHASADCRGVSRLQHQHRVSAAVKPVDGTGGNITAASYNYQLFCTFRHFTSISFHL